MGSRLRRWLGCGLAAAAAFGGLASVTSLAPAAASPTRTRVESLPAGFTDTVVAKIHKPVALAATPDGRILVADQAGRIRVIEGGVLLPTPALDISPQVCSTNSERGMLGVAVDPQFATNGYLYVYYTFKKFGSCPIDSADAPVNRVSRFTMVGDTIDPSTEKILIDEMISYHGIHNAGDVGFGNDGFLYVSVGDGGCDYTGLSGCEIENAISQRGNTLQGKVLRIRSNGGIPKSNPFTGAGTARCNHGAIASGMTCQEIYMLGFRNPLRFAFDPNTPKTRMFVDDVGANHWEEVDKAVKGANYGWNVREGPCVAGSTVDCGPPPAGMTNPIFSYSHDTGCGAITGGAFTPAGIWGGAYDAGYFYGDFVCGQISFMTQGASRRWTATPFATDLGVGGPVAMMFGPHAGATSLYYTSLENHGEVHVIDQG